MKKRAGMEAKGRSGSLRHACSSIQPREYQWHRHHRRTRSDGTRGDSGDLGVAELHKGQQGSQVLHLVALSVLVYEALQQAGTDAGGGAGAGRGEGRCVGLVCVGGCCSGITRSV